MTVEVVAGIDAGALREVEAEAQVREEQDVPGEAQHQKSRELNLVHVPDQDHRLGLVEVHVPWTEAIHQGQEIGTDRKSVV